MCVGPGLRPGLSRRRWWLCHARPLRSAHNYSRRACGPKGTDLHQFPHGPLLLNIEPSLGIYLRPFCYPYRASRRYTSRHRSRPYSSHAVRSCNIRRTYVTCYGSCRRPILRKTHRSGHYTTCTPGSSSHLGTAEYYYVSTGARHSSARWRAGCPGRGHYSIK